MVNFFYFSLFFFFTSIHSITANNTPTSTSYQNTSRPASSDISPIPNDADPVFPLTIEEPSKETDKFFMEFLNMLATLGFVIALILIIAWFLKRMVNSRMEQANANSSIRIVEKRGLSPKSMLYLIEVGEKTVLISESHNGVKRLTEYNTQIEDAEEPKPNSPIPFSQLLDKK